MTQQVTSADPQVKQLRSVVRIGPIKTINATTKERAVSEIIDAMRDVAYYHTPGTDSILDACVERATIAFNLLEWWSHDDE